MRVEKWLQKYYCDFLSESLSYGIKLLSQDCLIFTTSCRTLSQHSHYQWYRMVWDRLWLS